MAAAFIQSCLVFLKSDFRSTRQLAAHPRSLAGLKQCMLALGLKRGWVVSTAPEHRMLLPGIEQIPWSAVVSGKVDLF